MSCFYCKGEIEASFTVYTAQIDKAIILIKNIPCEKCSQCGEIEISDEVMQQLEKIIYNTKQVIQELSIIDYQAAA